MPHALVTGGAGFVGSHMCDLLVSEGWQVMCVDSLITGARENVGHLLDDQGFSFVQADVSEAIPYQGPLDCIVHMASPASPRDYLEYPIETLMVNSQGTWNALELARRTGASFLLTSTSEVYGDPLVHPQPENYWGNVNPIGPRSVYDEGKRFAEALTFAVQRKFGTRIHVARIFNTYGPRMKPHDGRAVPTFIAQALANEPITVQGTGTQTRSLCYVADLVDGLRKLMDANVEGPVNLGNSEEITVRELAERIRALTSSSSEIVFVPRPEDDPEVRRPVVELAREELGWTPLVGLDEGLESTIAWFRSVNRSA